MTASAPNPPPTVASQGDGMPAPWVLPEDGIVDPIAVEIAAAGTRRVALTATERLLAAARILAAGHHQTEMARRLGVSYDTARTLAALVRRFGLLPVPDLWALAYPPADAEASAA
ncbi:hypothetical protein [Actinomadura rudentiformis]|uniref:Uncharacterized protein n=1 Tax=Actinomadura rudentiformis TaxID=359158 RepID=A0A6H9Z1V8_9ACTN|nr:hypothetical protein [Actinomadura rudentiformis]KAB2347247.1 hypothetical protein F8566_19685 [Actinomadura rudentiformis]